MNRPISTRSSSIALGRFVVGAAIVVANAGCFDLDSFVWNPKHCSTITDELCETKDMCAKCGDRGPWEGRLPPGTACGACDSLSLRCR